MIKQVNITNLQSHKDSSLDFVEGVNIIVGNSDSGKSAIIRALRWLVFNRPSGDAIRSSWGGKTMVEMFTDDAHIVRSKDKEEEYILGDMHFKAFRTDVPQAITNALGINEINLQYQLDAPFLLSSTAGEVAQHFNKIAHLDKIDTGLYNINSAIRKITNDITYNEASEKTLQEDLKKFDHLEQFEAEVVMLEGMGNNLRSLQGSASALDEKIYDYRQCEMFIEGHQVLLADEGKVNTVLGLYGEKVILATQKEGIRTLIDDIAIVEDSIRDANEYVKDEKTVNDILDLYNSKKIVVERALSVSKLLSNLTYTSSDINKNTLKLKELEGKWEKAMPVGSVCILCGQIIKKK